MSLKLGELVLAAKVCGDCSGHLGVTASNTATAINSLQDALTIGYRGPKGAMREG